MAEQYEGRLISVRKFINGEISFKGPNQHTFLLEYKYRGSISDSCQSFIDQAVQKIRNHKGESDFDIIVIVRFLFLNVQNNEKYNRLTEIVDSLNKFPFWPNGRFESAENIVF
eukprot:gene17530-24303_t